MPLNYRQKNRRKDDRMAQLTENQDMQTKIMMKTIMIDKIHKHSRKTNKDQVEILDNNLKD